MRICAFCIVVIATSDIVQVFERLKMFQPRSRRADANPGEQFESSVPDRHSERTVDTNNSTKGFFGRLASRADNVFGMLNIERRYRVPRMVHRYLVGRESSSPSKIVPSMSSSALPCNTSPSECPDSKGAVPKHKNLQTVTPNPIVESTTMDRKLQRNGERSSSNSASIYYAYFDPQTNKTGSSHKSMGCNALAYSRTRPKRNNAKYSSSPDLLVTGSESFVKNMQSTFAKSSNTAHSAENIRDHVKGNDQVDRTLKKILECKDGDSSLFDESECSCGSGNTELFDRNNETTASESLTYVTRESESSIGLTEPLEQMRPDQSEFRFCSSNSSIYEFELGDLICLCWAPFDSYLEDLLSELCRTIRNFPVCTQGGDDECANTQYEVLLACKDDIAGIYEMYVKKCLLFENDCERLKDQLVEFLSDNEELKGIKINDTERYDSIKTTQPIADAAACVHLVTTCISDMNKRLEGCTKVWYQANGSTFIFPLLSNVALLVNKSIEDHQQSEILLSCNKKVIGQIKSSIDAVLQQLRAVVEGYLQVHRTYGKFVSKIDDNLSILRDMTRFDSSDDD